MKQPAGYCRLHQEQMSVREIKLEGCIDPKKQLGKAKCHYLKKYPDHPHWVQKEILKEFRKAGML